MLDVLYVAFYSIVFRAHAFVRPQPGCAGPRTRKRNCPGQIMSIESIVGVAVAVAILMYLVYSLLRPERF